MFFKLKYLRIVIANIIKSAKINEEILHSLNYNTKEEYINYVTTKGNWCCYQELTYLVLQYNILIAIYSSPTRYKNYDQWYFI